MTTTEIRINELAAQVIPAAALESFKALDLRAKLTGIATFAHIAGDAAVRDEALRVLAA